MDFFEAKTLPLPKIVPVSASVFPMREQRAYDAEAVANERSHEKKNTHITHGLKPKKVLKQTEER
jgi:hypothetical protein